MSTTLTITVTKEILEKSKMCKYDGDFKYGSTCAFSRAVRDIFPAAHVGYHNLYPFGLEVGAPETGSSFPITEEMARFIMRFDHTLPNDRPNLPEQSFDIELPDWVIEKIDISELKPLLENHPTLKLQTV